VEESGGHLATADALFDEIGADAVTQAAIVPR
jgi:hypothetical protein